MATSLTHFLFDSHLAGGDRALARVPARAGERPLADVLERVHIDHVLLGAERGTVAFSGFEAIGASRFGCELALIGMERAESGPEDAEDARYLRSGSQRWGGRFAAPGSGSLAALYGARFAGPGHTLLSSEPGAAAGGAFGMLVLAGGPTEAAAALAGEPHACRRPRVLGVRVVGRPEGTPDPHALLEAIAVALGGDLANLALEFLGPGLGELDMSVRIALAERAALRGAVHSVFPADDATRAHLRALGRDADWRRLEGGDDGFESVIELDLAVVPAATATPETEHPLETEATPVLEPAPLLESASIAIERGAHHAPAPLGVPLEGSVRGVALLALGDRVESAQLLGWGARTVSLRADAAAIADFALRALDPEFAARARSHGGGFLVAGEEFGAGGGGEHAARALAALGVRAVLARSFHPELRHQLVLQGVLPLTFLRRVDAMTLAGGEELELAGLSDALEPGRPLVMRNLTRGGTHGVQHGLDPQALEIARAGGLLALVAFSALVPVASES